MGWRPVQGISPFCDQCMLQPEEDLMNWELQRLSVFHSLKEKKRELCSGSSQGLSWLTTTVNIHPLTLCDCSIMCGMLLLFHQRILWSPLSWKLLLIQDYPLNFLSGLTHLHRICSLFFSVVNHWNDQDIYVLMWASWLKLPCNTELQSDVTVSEVRGRGDMLSSVSYSEGFRASARYYKC